MTALAKEFSAESALSMLDEELRSRIVAGLDSGPLSDETFRLFGLPDDLVYMDWAYMSPLARAAEAASDWAMERRRQPWRLQRRDFFDEVEACRALFALLVNGCADNVALVPAASYGIAVAVSILQGRKSGRIVVPNGEHYSNYYAWKRLASRPGWSLDAVTKAEAGDWTEAVLGSIGPDVAVVAVPACHWVDGSTFDLDRIAMRTREVGAALVLDTTQTVGAMPLDVSRLKPDFMVVSAYKWTLGPYGLCYLHVDEKYFDAEPLELHSYHRAGAEGRGTRVEYTDALLPGARRFDAGERSNFVTLPHAVAGLAQLLQWGSAQIASQSSALVRAIEEGAGEIGVGVPAGDRTGANMTGLSCPGGWNESHLAKLRKAGIRVSLRGDILRVSPFVSNTQAEVGRLLAVIGDLRAG